MSTIIKHNLQMLNVVAIVANHFGERRLAQLRKLKRREDARILVPERLAVSTLMPPRRPASPETIAVSKSSKLLADYAGECRANECAGQRPLDDAADPKVDVAGMTVERAKLGDRILVLDVDR